jgi:hypothetical protein
LAQPRREVNGASMRRWISTEPVEKLVDKSRSASKDGVKPAVLALCPKKRQKC